MSKVKGNQIKARMSLLKERYGEAGLEKVLASLSEEDQAELRGVIMNVGWYDFWLAARFDQAIIDVLEQGQSSLFEELGRASAKENLQGVHKNLLEPREPLAFMQKTRIIYTFHYDTGSREWEESGPTSGYMVTRDAETYSVADCMTNIGYFKQGLELCGAKNIVIVEEECRAKGGAVCRFRVNWDE